MEQTDQIKTLLEELEATTKALEGLNMPEITWENLRTLRDTVYFQLLNSQSQKIVELTDLGVELPISPHRLHTARDHMARKFKLNSDAYKEAVKANHAQCQPCVEEEAKIEAEIAKSSTREEFWG